MARQAPVYSRSLTNDLASLLGSLRQQAWCEPQRLILDRFIVEFIDQTSEHDPSFDADRFATRAKFWHDRLPTAGEIPALPISHER